mgnify:CR=1 FL=1
MLAIGRALIGRPSLRLLDDPSMGLAPHLADEVFTVIETIKAQGMTILLVEKNAFAALAIANIRSGSTRLTMSVRHDMVNGHADCHADCHGGMLFTWVDTAFAYACNSYNRKTVASACNIDVLATAHLGDSLVAEHHIRHNP